MASIDRYRVRPDHRAWTDKGPDLLRERRNARAAFRHSLGRESFGWFVRLNRGTRKGAWKGPMNRAEVMDKFDAWGNQANEFVAGRKSKGGNDQPDAVALAKRESVRVILLPNCSRATSIAHSLIHHQFPRSILSGGYVFKTIEGSSPPQYSDHAHGDAVDETENPPEPTNDELTDWCTRMGQTRNLEFDYLLGSRNGKVVTCGAPDYQLEPSGASTSHRWHNHLSIVDHDGRRP